jgi:hypothetical protein
MKLTEVWNNIRYSPYRFKHNYMFPLNTWFKNIWVFRKELAHAQPWDYHGLLLLMRKQIQTMEDGQRVYGNHLNAHKIAKDMRVVIKLLDRLIEDDYTVQTDGKYDWVPCEKEGFTQMVCTEPREAKYIFPKGSSKQLYKHEENRKKADIEMLFKYMKQYRSWWD